MKHSKTEKAKLEIMKLNKENNQSNKEINKLKREKQTIEKQVKILLTKSDKVQQQIDRFEALITANNVKIEEIKRISSEFKTSKSESKSA